MVGGGFKIYLDMREKEGERERERERDVEDEDEKVARVDSGEVGCVLI